MKYLKIFERYSQPNSIDKLSKEICELIKSEFEKWVFRKGLANYSHVYRYSPKFKDPDFPVSLVKLHLIISLSNKYGFNRTGQSYYRVYGEPEHEMSPQIKENGDTEIGIIVNIFVPKSKESFSGEEIDDLLTDMLMHEIQHSYDDYKLQIKNIDQNEDVFIAKSIHTIRLDFYDLIAKKWKNGKKSKWKIYKSDKIFGLIDDFFLTAYICSSKKETSAHLSQLYAKEGDQWVDGFLKVKKMTMDEVLNLFNPYKNQIQPLINEFYKNVSFEDYIEGLYNLIDDKKDYLFRKLIKIKSTPDYKSIN